VDKYCTKKLGSCSGVQGEPGTKKNDIIPKNTEVQRIDGMNGFVPTLARGK